MNQPWLVLAGWAAAAALVASARPLYRWLAGRRADRRWFAYIAAKPRGPELLTWLREQRAAVRRHRCVRPIPRDAAELEEWEREEIDRMETFYDDDGMDPYGKRQPWRSA